MTGLNRVGGICQYFGCDPIALGYLPPLQWGQWPPCMKRALK